MAGFQVAADLGVGFELDVQLSRCGVAMVIHDETVDRTTCETGPVSGFTAKQLSRMDAGCRFDPKFINETIPTLLTVLKTFGHLGIDVEIKTNPGQDRALIAAAVVHDIIDANMVDDVVVTSFDPIVLGHVRRLNPSIIRGLIVSDFHNKQLGVTGQLLSRLRWMTRIAGPDMMMMDHRTLTKQTVASQHESGRSVFAWTVNTDTEIRSVLALGADGVITDVPNLANSIVRK